MKVNAGKLFNNAWADLKLKAPNFSSSFIDTIGFMLSAPDRIQAYDLIFSIYKLGSSKAYQAVNEI